MSHGSVALTVSFHGGDSSTGIKNLRRFPQAAPSHEVLVDVDEAPELRELRAFIAGPDGHLYVAGGSPPAGNVLRFRPSSAADHVWTFDRVFAARDIAHPFDLCFWPDGTLLVSNQNSGTVTSYDRYGHLGPFSIASLNKVRGLATDGIRLFVAESGHHRVRVYDATGHHLEDVAAPNPIHLLVAAGWLWIGCGSASEVHAYDLKSPGSKPVRVVHGSHNGIDGAAGLCVTEFEGCPVLLVASRLGRQVLRFPLTFGKHGRPEWSPKTSTVLLDKDVLTDHPEFIDAAARD